MNSELRTKNKDFGTLGEGVSQDGDARLTLGLLNAVESDSKITQREVAQNLGVALGLVNAYIKRCVKKGFIKVSQAPASRYAYYLTPKGFSEKSRLTAQYLSSSFDFFRGARRQCSELLHSCDRLGWGRVALIGMSDLSEIAILCARECNIELIGIVDSEYMQVEHLGLPVVRKLVDLSSVEAVVLTDLRTPQKTYNSLRQQMPEERILTPSLLGVSVESQKL